MNTISREFQIFVKPVGADCNLGCKYCYYLEKSSLYGGAGNGRMSDIMLETYIRQHIEATTDNQITFSWHGGEPLLAGIDFYRKIMDLQKHYVQDGKSVINGIQTNGTLIDDKWCKFFSENNFVIGISLDGPAFLHDRYRTGRDGRVTWEEVMMGYNMLSKYKVSTEIICVVNDYNVMYPLQVYRFFKSLGIKYITFIPLVESVGGRLVSKKTVPAEDYGAFLTLIFDEWKAEDVGKIKIQIIEEALRISFSQDHTLCIFKEVCGGVPVVELNGDFYSCDHYVDQDYLVGNIAIRSIAEMIDSPEQLLFGEKKFTGLPGYCLKCDVREMCNGGCPKNRIIKTPDGIPGLNYLCKGYMQFFRHIKPFADSVGAAWKSA